MVHCRPLVLHLCQRRGLTLRERGTLKARPLCQTLEVRGNPVQIFLSRPTWIAPEFEPGVSTFLTQLDNMGLTPRTLGVSDYPSKAPLDEVIDILASCQGAIVLGIPQIEVKVGILKGKDIVAPLTLGTEWNHLEAGLAYAASLPLLVIHHLTVSRGIFDRGVMNAFLHSVDLSLNNWSMQPALNGAIKRWKDSCASGGSNFRVENRPVPSPVGKPVCPNCSTTAKPIFMSPIPDPFSALAGGEWECSKCKYVQ